MKQTKYKAVVIIAIVTKMFYTFIIFKTQTCHNNYHYVARQPS